MIPIDPATIQVGDRLAINGWERALLTVQGTAEGGRLILVEEHYPRQVGYRVIDTERGISSAWQPIGPLHAVRPYLAGGFREIAEAGQWTTLEMKETNPAVITDVRRVGGRQDPPDHSRFSPYKGRGRTT